MIGTETTQNHKAHRQPLRNRFSCRECAAETGTPWPEPAKHTCNEGDDCELFDVDPIIIATTDLEVALDVFSAASYSIAVKAANFGYHPLAATKAQDRRYLAGLQRDVNDAVREFFGAVQDAGVEHAA
jgi:hypothetical protein